MAQNKELEQLKANAALQAGDGQRPPLSGDGVAASVVTVHMVRDPAYGFPVEADVHPDEVANWQEHGWVIEE